jgi:hypothetical protein
MAVIFPGSKLTLRSSSTFTWGRLGYAKVTDASRSSSWAETSGSLSPTLDGLGASTVRMEISSGSFGLCEKNHHALKVTY